METRPQLKHEFSGVHHLLREHLSLVVEVRLALTELPHLDLSEEAVKQRSHELARQVEKSAARVARALREIGKTEAECTKVAQLF